MYGYGEHTLCIAGAHENAGSSKDLLAACSVVQLVQRQTRLASDMQRLRLGNVTDRSAVIVKPLLVGPGFHNRRVISREAWFVDCIARRCARLLASVDDN